MKRFYTTSSPDAARHILRETFLEASDEAQRQVRAGTHTKRYIVQIIAIVERDNPPVVVRMLNKTNADEFEE